MSLKIFGRVTSARQYLLLLKRILSDGIESWWGTTDHLSYDVKTRRHQIVVLKFAENLKREQNEWSKTNYPSLQQKSLGCHFKGNNQTVFTASNSATRVLQPEILSYPVACKAREYSFERRSFVEHSYNNQTCLLVKPELIYLRCPCSSASHMHKLSLAFSQLLPRFHNNLTLICSVMSAVPKRSASSLRCFKFNDFFQVFDITHTHTATLCLTHFLVNRHVANTFRKP